MPTEDKDFDAVVRRLDSEFTRRLGGKDPTPQQIREFWDRVARAKKQLVEKQVAEDTNRLVMDAFKYRGIPIKDMGNHQYWVMPSSTQVIQFEWLEELNQKLPEGKKVRAIKPHQKGIAILVG